MSLVWRNLAWMTASVAALVGVYHAFVGPIHLDWHGLRLSSSDPLRAGVVAGFATAAALWTDEHSTDRAQLWWRRFPASAAAVLLAAVTVGFGLLYMTAVAGAADAYGYVSQALLWTHGSLEQSAPLTTEPLLGQGAAPLGYVVRTPGTIVPIYPPGLPLLMAAFARVAGEPAVYAVVPLLGGLTVWLTFVLGRQLAHARVGLASAVLMAAGPMFVFQLFAPMSDVPATCWWLAALVAASSDTRWAGVLAGLAASAAALTRPNLVPLVMPVVCILVLRERRRGLLVSFLGGLAPGVLALAVNNAHLYGSPLHSGYGRFQDLFRLSWLGVNLRSYPAWQLHVYGPFLLVGIVAPLVMRSLTPERRRAWIHVLVVAVVFACYMFYLPMDGWPSARFLLPAMPSLTVLACIVGNAVVARLPPRARLASGTLAVMVLAAWYLSHAQQLGAFAMAGAEQRYVVVGNYIDRALPANAVLVSGLHSGTSRLYGHRTSIRWTEIASGDLHRALDLLRTRGLAPYIVLDSSEEPLFRERFASDGELGNLAWRPLFEYPGEPGVRVYAVDAD